MSKQEHSLLKSLILLISFLFVFSPAYSYLDVSPAEDYLCSGPEGGPFAPEAKIYTLTNLGDTALFWGVDESAAWLDCSLEWGLLDPNESINVQVSITSAAESLTGGDYNEDVIFTDISNAQDYTRTVILTVTSNTSGPVAWWKLDGDATDSSGNGHDGTVYGDPNWIIEGKIDGAIQLDGVDDYVETPFILNPSGGTFSAFAWIKPSQLTGPILVQSDGAEGVGRVWLNISSSYTLGTVLQDDDGVWNPLISEYSISIDQWQHVGFVWDGQRRYLYANGILVKQDKDAIGNLEPCDGQMRMGITKDGNGLYTGLIDDVRIYRRALTSAEIAELAGIGPLIVMPDESFSASGEPGGPFSPAYKDYTLKNMGDESLYWGIDALPDWVDVDKSFGKLDPNTSTIIRAFLTADAELLPEGLYSDTITFNNLSSVQDPVTRDVSLNVSYIHGIWTDPDSFTIQATEGTLTQQTLTIGNDGDQTLTFSIRSRSTSGAASASVPAIELAKRVPLPAVPPLDIQQALQQEYTPDRLLVRFAPDRDNQYLTLQRQTEILSADSNPTILRQYDLVQGLSLIEIPDGMTMEEALTLYNNTEGILYAQPDYIMYADAFFPNDARFNDLWGLHNTGQTGGYNDADIDAPEAWDLSTGADSVIVAVIDTGVDYNHEDLKDNMWVNQPEFNGTPGVDDDGNGYVDDIYGYDFYNNDGNPMDDHYHGTHCAGTIGAVGNNGKGITGVCWNVKIMAVKFLSSSGSAPTSIAINCVEYATLMGANVMSNSWGGGSYNQGLKDAIDAAGAAGILFIAAAGNDSVNNDTYPHYPSSYTSDNIIAVMATDDEDKRSSFSCWGPVSVDIGAPGTSILSCEPGNQYQYLNGTSMATPHVSGACALLWSVNPGLTAAEVKDLLLNTAEPTLSGKCVSGGRLNINNAILETTVPWLEFDIEQGQLEPGQSMDVTVTFNALGLTPGIYHAEILILSDDPARPQLTVPVEFTVLNDPLEVTPETSFDPNGLEGGPFVPESITYTLSNTGDTALDWSVQWLADWLTVDPAAGTLQPQETIEVLVSITDNTQTLLPGLYEDTIGINNLTAGSIQYRQATLSVRPPDKFTQMFTGGVFDLENTSITFRPNGRISYYAACIAKDQISAFPVNPADGGTFISVGDDDFAEIIFTDGRQMNFFGTLYDRIYISSNGYLTFGQGDTEFDPILEYHFDLPRIAALFTDLTPPNNLCISYQQTEDRFVATYQNIPVFGSKTATNSFQVELFFADGVIRISYLNVDALGVIAGLSDGNGLPGFFEASDLSSYMNCCDCGDVDGDSVVGISDLYELALAWMNPDCTAPDWCGRTDFDRSGQVDLADFTMLSQNWQKLTYTWSEPEFLLELNGKTWTQPQYLSELNDNQGNKARTVGISDDLLTVVFARYVPSQALQLLFQATRSSTDKPFSQEQLLSELSLTGGGMGGPSLSAHGERLYYHENQPSTGESLIKVATWSETLQQWVYERTLDELHYAGYSEYHPSLTEDELTIFFHSTRPDGAGTSSIWTASRSSTEEPFTNIRQLTELDTLIEGASVPDILPEGLTLYFHTMDPQTDNSSLYKVSRASLSEPFANLEKIAFPDNETMWELNCSVSPDGNTVYFQNGDAFDHGGIWMITFQSDPGTMPAGHPNLTDDELKIFYNRNVPELGQKCIFEATRASLDEPFSNEKMLGELIQTGGNLGSPWLSSDGRRLYYHEAHLETSESMMKMAVWSSENNQWQYARTLDEIHYGPNTVTIFASLTDDELNIFWCSTRPDGAGGWDLWMASRSDIHDSFENIRPIEEINTSLVDSTPRISSDGLTLYFNSIRQSGSIIQEIYRATRSSLSEPFGNIELIDVTPNESITKLHPYISEDETKIYFELSKEGQAGCFVSELVPVYEDCLPR